MRFRKAIPRSVITPAAVLVLAVLGGAGGSGREDLQSAAAAGRSPVLSPDYAGIVVPPNIAPLNFRVKEAGAGYLVRISASSESETPIEVFSKDGRIDIPLKKWRPFLERNKGGPFAIDIFVKDESGKWLRFDRVVNAVALEPIDNHLTYRRMVPWYQTYQTIGIYQRDVETFREDVILLNSDYAGGPGGPCINCHAFSANRPGKMTIHSRFPFVMLRVADGKVTPMETRTDFNKAPFAYTSWHPGGRWAVYSVNKILQVYHTVGETRDVLDYTSDLILYDFDGNRVMPAREIALPGELETFPAWSADGRYLYFCRTALLPGEPLERYRDIQYDLVRAAFDPETGAMGAAEAVLPAAATGKSASMPRPSPDGRHLLFCLSDYGTFPIFHAGSDLYLLDLETGAYAPLACNSGESEAWHSWSANGRWIVFSSKRSDGLFARLYISYIDADGNAGKAFVLPQKDPSYYDALAETYSVPELIGGPVAISRAALGNALRHSEEAVKVTVDPALPGPAPDTKPEQPALEYGNQS